LHSRSDIQPTSYGGRSAGRNDKQNHSTGDTDEIHTIFGGMVAAAGAASERAKREFEKAGWILRSGIRA